jgi:hypothetical protein
MAAKEKPTDEDVLEILAVAYANVEALRRHREARADLMFRPVQCPRSLPFIIARLGAPFQCAEGSVNNFNAGSSRYQDGASDFGKEEGH